MKFLDVYKRQGKITPAQKEWAKSYALSDPKGFGSFVEKAPQIVPMDKIELDLSLIPIYIRVMNRVEDKLDQILYGGKAKGKEE